MYVYTHTYEITKQAIDSISETQVVCSTYTDYMREVLFEGFAQGQPIGQHAYQINVYTQVHSSLSCTILALCWVFD